MPKESLTDKFGVKKLYCSLCKPHKIPLPTDNEWYCNWGAGTAHLLDETNDFDSQDPRLGETCGTNGKLHINGNGTATIIGPDSSPRLYVRGSWLNTEQTVYVRVRGSVTSIQLRSRANHHGVNSLPYGKAAVGAPDDASCGFGNYLVRWCNVGMTDDVEVELEIMHGLYKRGLAEQPFTIPLNKWVGYKTTCITQANGYVTMTAYNDMEANQNWTQTTTFTFDGSNAPVDNADITDPTDGALRIAYCTGKGDNLCPDINSHQIFNSPGIWNWVRINNPVNVDLKWWSIREVKNQLLV